MALRYLEGPPATLQQQADRLFARLRAERGVAAGDSLDIETVFTRDGPVSRVLPLAEARTLRYAEVIVADDRTVAALRLDDWAIAQQGRGGVDISGHKDEAELDARLRERVAAPETAQPDRQPAPAVSAK